MGEMNFFDYRVEPKGGGRLTMKDAVNLDSLLLLFHYYFYFITKQKIHLNNYLP